MLSLHSFHIIINRLLHIIFIAHCTFSFIAFLHCCYYITVGHIIFRMPLILRVGWYWVTLCHCIDVSLAYTWYRYWYLLIIIHYCLLLFSLLLLLATFHCLLLFLHLLYYFFATPADIIHDFDITAGYVCHTLLIAAFADYLRWLSLYCYAILAIDAAAAATLRCCPYDTMPFCC